MHFTTLVIASLPVLGAFAAPKVDCTSMSIVPESGCSSCSSIFGVTTTTLSLTLTVTSTHVYTATASASTTEAVTTTSSVSTTTSSAAPNTTPTSAYGLIAARSASPVHLLSWSAAGLRFWLGGSTASYCPDSVQQTGSCPPGNYTAFLGTCDMDVIVPGGQQIYVTPQGEIGYTQAHSLSRPAGSNVCPFAYSKPADSSFGYVTLDPAIAFGATGFMACPTDSGYYQVFANLKDAVVPKGNASDCLGISALASDYAGFAAWQYT